MGYEQRHTVSVQGGVRLAANSENLNQGLVVLTVFALEVVQQSTARVDHLDQTMTGAMVFSVLLHVVGQFLNPLGEQCYLYVRGPRVLLVKLKLFLNRFLVYLAHCLLLFLLLLLLLLVVTSLLGRNIEGIIYDVKGFFGHSFCETSDVKQSSNGRERSAPRGRHGV